MIIEGITVTNDPGITEEEARAIVLEEQYRWKLQGKQIARIDLSIDGEEIIVKAVEKSPIKRLRRITGYLSNVDNFNDAKRHELNDRRAHV